MTMTTMMTLHNSQPDDDNDEDKDDDEDKDYDKDGDDDKYDTHLTSDWLKMKMTTTLEDQRTTYPTMIAWRTTIPDNNGSDNEESFDVDGFGNNRGLNSSRSSDN
jgi:hypothetical protein